jgi:hypothetical protein
MDLLCSDLTTVKLSVAVAASAAFPVALSPVTLKNYSPCGLQHGVRWPPLWTETAVGSDWYVNPSRVRRGRIAQAYAKGTDVAPPHGKAYIHLLDGGIADNLGVSEPFRLLTTMDVSPKFLNHIAQGRIKRVVFILINARSDPPSTLNDQVATPGIVDMLLGTINTALDSATFSTIRRLRVLLEEQFKAAAQTMPPVLAANFGRDQLDRARRRGRRAARRRRGPVECRARLSARPNLGQRGTRAAPADGCASLRRDGPRAAGRIGLAPTIPRYGFSHTSRSSAMA